MKKLFILFIAVAGFGVSSYGQVNATSSAAATIVTPISISNEAVMDFGNIAVGATGGTAILGTNGDVTTGTGDVKISAIGAGSSTAADFLVSGQADYTYTIAVSPASIVLEDDASVGFDMTVGSWVTSPTPTGTLSGAGIEHVLVGATLTVGAAQAPGHYSSATPLTVTVNYN